MREAQRHWHSVQLAEAEPHGRRRRLQASQVCADSVGWRGEQPQKSKEGGIEAVLALASQTARACCAFPPLHGETLRWLAALPLFALSALLRAATCASYRIALTRRRPQSSSPMSRGRVSEHKAQLAAIKSTHITITITERASLETLEGALRAACPHICQFLTRTPPQLTLMPRCARRAAPTTIWETPMRG